MQDFIRNYLKTEKDIKNSNKKKKIARKLENHKNLIFHISCKLW